VFRLNSAARRTGISKGKSVSLLVLTLGAAVFPEMHRRRAASYHCTPSRISGLLTSAAQNPTATAFSIALSVIPNPAGWWVRNLNASLSALLLSSPLREGLGVCKLTRSVRSRSHQQKHNLFQKKINKDHLDAQTHPHPSLRGELLSVTPNKFLVPVRSVPLYERG